MKFEIERDVLVSALKRVGGVVERRNTIPILSNILIEGRTGSVTFTGTDLDLRSEVTVNAQTEVLGSTTVPSVMLQQIASKSVAKTLSFSLKDNKLHVRSGRSNFKLETLPPEDFPEFAKKETRHIFTISASDLTKVLGAPQFAISNDETRYFLNGVYLHVWNNKLRGVASDGHRLATSEIDVPDGAEHMAGTIIHKKTVGEALKLATSGEISVSVSDSQIRFETESTVLASKIIDAQYPDYAAVIPSNEKSVRFDRAELAGAIGRVSIVSGGMGRAIKLTFENGKLNISVGGDSGSASEELDIEYAYDPLEVGFNSSYATDILAEIPGATVELLLNDSQSPSLWRAAGDDSFQAILMPMRV